MTAHNEKLLDETYETLINVALGGMPLQNIDGLLSDQFMAYGTAPDEELYGYNSFKWMVERQWAELENVKPEIKRHQKFKKLFSNANSALIVEEMEIIVGKGDEANAILLRLSTIMEYTAEKWMILHFHGSTADANTLEGNAWPIEEWKRRNIELEKMVAEKTADLVTKNRELEIEAALERIRAKVMAMNSSKDLDETSLAFGEQLRKLRIDWQFSYFWLVEEAKNENTFWITWPDYKTSITIYTLAEAEEYFNECLISWRAGVKIHDNYVRPEEVQEWLDTYQRIADDAGGEAKKIMVPQTFSSGVYYYDAMMKYGSFGICISKPATDEEKNIQCRFAVEFERAYTRFLDLQKAEAQTREAQIELGLERVRARAMAMQKSDELVELVDTVFKEWLKDFI